MKKRIALLLISILLVAVFTGCGAKKEETTETKKEAATETKKEAATDTKSQEVFTLKLADMWALTHVASQSSQEFIKKVEERSNGRIKFQHFPAAQLGKTEDMLRIAGDGTADVSAVAVSFVSSNLPLSSATILPYYTTSAEGTYIWHKLIKTPELKAEYAKNGVVPIYAWATNHFDVWTTKKEVKTVEDLKNLKIMASGGYFSFIVSALGAIPVSMGTGELYEALSKGIIDGYVVSAPSIAGYKLDELMKYGTYGLRLGSAPPVWVMNKKSWDKLPADLQKIIEEVGDEVSVLGGERWDEFAFDALEKFEAKGMKITKISPEERAKWDAPLKELDKKWLDDMNAKGLPGQAVLDNFKKFAAEATKK